MRAILISLLIAWSNLTFAVDNLNQLDGSLSQKGQQSVRNIGAGTPTTMATGIFTSAGDVWIYDFVCEQITLATQTAELWQFQGINANGSGNISLASTTIGGMTVGSTMSLQLYNIANAPAISASSAGISVEQYGHMFIPGGTTIKIARTGTVGTTSTFSCYATFIANDIGATLTPLF